MQTAPTLLRTTVRALSLALLSLGFGVTHAKLPPPPFLGAPPAAGAAAGSDPRGDAPFMLGAPGLSPSPQAGAEPGPHHFGSIEQFKYSPNVVFEIRARVGSFVNVEVPANEQIIGFYLSDTTLWRFVVAQDQSRILVKAGRAGLSNSATLVTNRRVYELSFLAVPSGQPWHQRVQWSADQPQSHAWGVFEPAFRAFADPAAMRHQCPPRRGRHQCPHARKRIPSVRQRKTRPRGRIQPHQPVPAPGPHPLAGFPRYDNQRRDLMRRPHQQPALRQFRPLQPAEQRPRRPRQGQYNR